jgi:hypothetical protein
VLDAALSPLWTIKLVSVCKNALNLISDPSVGVRADLGKHLPDCLNFDIAAVRWISSRRLLISAQPLFCVNSLHPPLAYTVDVTDDEIVRSPEWQAAK